MSALHTITTDVLNPAVPVQQPTHVCVWPNGTMLRKESVAELVQHKRLPDNYATVQLRAGESMEDAAWRHTQAEQRYWASL